MTNIDAVLERPKIYDHLTGMTELGMGFFLLGMSLLELGI